MNFRKLGKLTTGLLDDVGKTLWLDLKQQVFQGSNNFVQEHIGGI